MEILIVDDSKMMRKIIRTTLENLGYKNIAEAENGKEALDRVLQQTPALILLDWNMPVMDGITFLEEFRTTNKKTPVVMVTTEAEKSRVIQAIKAGVNNYIVKPFTPDAISDIIQKTMSVAA